VARLGSTKALGVAQAAGNRLLGAGILGVMRHQATCASRFAKAANPARAAIYQLPAQFIQSFGRRLRFDLCHGPWRGGLGGGCLGVSDPADDQFSK
jgi:hypothetical protein